MRSRISDQIIIIAVVLRSYCGRIAVVLRSYCGCIAVVLRRTYCVVRIAWVLRIAVNHLTAIRCNIITASGRIGKLWIIEDKLCWGGGGVQLH